MSPKEMLPMLVVLAVASCQRGSLPTPAPSATAGAGRLLPSRWVGVALEKGRLAVSVTEVGEKPRRRALEPPVPGRLPGSVEVTDVAYDTRLDQIDVATCCEPGSGLLRRIAWRSRPDFLAHDQGFAVDVAGPAATVARTDTFGTLAIQPSFGEPEVRADAGVADVAVDGRGPARVLALVDSRRLRALVPTVSSHPPALLVRELKADGSRAETRHPLPAEPTFCRVVPLAGGTVGLLAGTVDAANPVSCTGAQLDVYDPAQRSLQSSVLRFPERVRHLSVDDSAAFLIFTTVTGAVGWQTLDGRGGDLAPEGFLAADW
jgi:hypothetical protein